MKLPKGKKLIAVVLGLVVILGIAGFLFLGKGKAQKEEEKPQKKEQEVIEYVALDPFVVNLKGGVNFMKVSITLEVAGKGGAQAVQKEMPAIRNQIIFLLTEKTYQEVITADGKRRLQEEIAERVNSILGKGEIRITGVYFTELIVQ